jgi:triphosphatase
MSNSQSSTGEGLKIYPADSMPEAGRKILLRYFEEMLKQEPVAFAGEDIEGVYKMRVAIRRIRSLYYVMGPLLPPNYQTGFPRRFKKTAAVLGVVRDLDVFQAHIGAYIAESLGGDGSGLAGLLAHLQGQHSQARAELQAYLESKTYLEFKQAFTFMLKEPASISHLPQPSAYPLTPKSVRVEHLLPPLIYERYQEVRRHEIGFPTRDVPSLHRLRIDAKRMRYTLDAFSDVLGVASNRVITAIKDLQEHLGDMNDAHVAIERLEGLRQELPGEQSKAILAYEKVWKTQLDQSLKGFPRVWRAFNRYQVRQGLAMTVARL